MIRPPRVMGPTCLCVRACASLCACMCECVHGQTVYGPGVLIQVALALTGMSSHSYIGGSKDLATSPLTGWSWSDGTPATNVNCGVTGCTCSVESRVA